MHDLDQSPFDAMTGYAVMYRFLHILENNAQEFDMDLNNVLRWGELRDEGTKSMDPAFLEIWQECTDNHATLSLTETYTAMTKFLEDYVRLGSGPRFAALTSRLKGNPAEFASFWREAVKLVQEDIAAGDPFRGTSMPHGKEPI